MHQASPVRDPINNAAGFYAPKRQDTGSFRSGSAYSEGTLGRQKAGMGSTYAPVPNKPGQELVGNTQPVVHELPGVRGSMIA